VWTVGAGQPRCSIFLNYENKKYVSSKAYSYGDPGCVCTLGTCPTQANGSGHAYLQHTRRASRIGMCTHDAMVHCRTHCRAVDIHPLPREDPRVHARINTGAYVCIMPGREGTQVPGASPRSPCSQPSRPKYIPLLRCEAVAHASAMARESTHR